jgi:prepilin signal peptidase PulO-like enzyme (type II secretory pathway)
MEITLSHLFESLVIVAIIIRQLFVTGQLNNKIKKLKDLNLHDTIVTKVTYPLSSLFDFKYDQFKHLIEKSLDPTEADIEYEENTISSALLHSAVEIEDTQRIIRELNTYMLKNDQHMINFNIIRDIVDRNYQVLDDEINQSLPTPLYLGLAATMMGIIFGLWGMFPIDTNNIENQIAPLLTGVAIAMTSSVLGVALTSLLTTVIYKKSKKEAEEEKNQFFSQLQADLLPELLRKDESAVETLNRNLDRFARVSSSSISELTSIAQSSAETLKMQSELMERVDRLNVRKVSTTNLEIFQRLENNLQSFDSFAKYWERLTESLSTTSDLAGKLHALLDRFKNIEGISNKIDQTLSDYKNTMGFFTAHIEEIKKGGDMSKLAVTQADLAFKEAIEQLTINTQQRIQNLNESSSIIDVELKEIGEEVAKRLKEATEAHISKLTAAYVEKTPDFEKLNKLDLLPQIHKAIEDSSTQIAAGNYTDNEKLISKISSLEKAINNLAENMGTNGNSISKKTIWSKIESFLRISATAIIVIGGITFTIILIINFLTK